MGVKEALEKIKAVGLEKWAEEYAEESGRGLLLPNLMH